MACHHITVAGKISDPKFQRSRAIATSLAAKHADRVQISVMEFFETQWDQFVKKTANRLKGVFYEHRGSPLIYLDDKEYVGDGDAFQTWALHNFNHKDELKFSEYETMAFNALKNKINNSKTRKYAEFKFTIAGEESAVILELFEDLCPKTVHNFLELCKGFKNQGGEEIGYCGAEVHRVVQGMFVQAGRVRHDTGFASAYNSEFADESFHVKHTEAGMLGMCKRSGLKHTNESQFYITTGAPLSFLDNQNVVFGRVIAGYSAIAHIESLPTMNEKPNETVKISACGVCTIA